jgi:hypothetical protein
LADNGKEEKMTKIDRQAIAAALAPMLGATLDPANECGDYGRTNLNVSPRLKLIFRETKRRLEVIASTIETHAERELISYSRIPTLGSATFDPSRPLETIAKAIKRNLIDANAEKIAAYEITLQTAKDDNTSLTAMAAAWEQKIPGLRATVKPGSYDAELRFYAGDGGGSWTARLRNDGGLNIDRASITPAQAEAFANIFAKGQ